MNTYDSWCCGIKHRNSDFASELLPQASYGPPSFSSPKCPHTLSFLVHSRNNTRTSHTVPFVPRLCDIKIQDLFKIQVFASFLSVLRLSEGLWLNFKWWYNDNCFITKPFLQPDKSTFRSNPPSISWLLPLRSRQVHRIYHTAASSNRC